MTAQSLTLYILPSAPAVCSHKNLETCGRCVKAVCNLDVFVAGPFVLDDAGAAVFVEAERVDASAVLLAGAVFAGQELNAEEGFEVGLDQVLQRFFERNRLAFEFGHVAVVGAEEFDVAHRLSFNKTLNTCNK